MSVPENLQAEAVGLMMELQGDQEKLGAALDAAVDRIKTEHPDAAVAGMRIAATLVDYTLERLDVSDAFRAFVRERADALLERLGRDVGAPLQ